MTRSTDTKNIKKIVQGILQSNGIDNLKVEVDMVSAFMRYMFEREDGVAPGDTKDKIAAEFGFFGTAHTDKARMMQLLMDTIGVEVDENKPEWMTVINFCLEAEKKNQTVSAYRAWMNSDPYNSPKKHQIAQNPLLIKQTWMSAFEQVKKTDETRPEYQPFPFGDKQ